MDSEFSILFRFLWRTNSVLSERGKIRSWLSHSGWRDESLRGGCGTPTGWVGGVALLAPRQALQHHNNTSNWLRFINFIKCRDTSEKSLMKTRKWKSSSSDMDFKNIFFLKNILTFFCIHGIQLKVQVCLVEQMLKVELYFSKNNLTINLFFPCLHQKRFNSYISSNKNWIL